jgi:hypothetical protein
MTKTGEQMLTWAVEYARRLYLYGESTQRAAELAHAYYRFDQARKVNRLTVAELYDAAFPEQEYGRTRE